MDVEIVLAVDVSNSIDEPELLMQRSGYVLALTHPDLNRAVETGYHGRIALSYFEYAGRVGRSRVPWAIIDGPETASAFAAAIAGLPTRFDYGTSISRAIEFGLESIGTNDIEGSRRVIDVSGDGPNNLGPPVEDARDRAVAGGVTVNGLPILIRPSWSFREIDRYYAECVIGGAGAFLLAARNPDELAPAIRRKLILEISGVEPGRLWAGAEPAEVDCLIGERLRRRRGDPYYPGLNE